MKKNKMIQFGAYIFFILLSGLLIMLKQRHRHRLINFPFIDQHVLLLNNHIKRKNQVEPLRQLS